MTHPLAPLADLPGVPDAVDRAREACTRLRWHPALRRRTEEVRTESLVRGARDSAALDGAELPVDLVRELLVGVREPAGPVELAVAGAVRASDRARGQEQVAARAPLQALAALHVAAAAGLVDDESLGRPRREGEEPRDLPGPGPAPSPAVVVRRLEALGGLLTDPADVPALVLAAVVHGELLVLRPFTVGNGVVARAAQRLLVVARGLDPTGTVPVESGHLGLGLPAYAAAAAGYAGGTPEGVAGWVGHCADAVVRGAQEGTAVADAVLAGRLG